MNVFAELAARLEENEPADREDDGCPPYLPDEAYAFDRCMPIGFDRVPAGPKRTSTFYSAATLKGKAVPERKWLVPDMVPQKTVTLFSGDGGTGKSLLALQLAVAVVAGTSWVGKSVQRGSALMISAEDDDDELHRRLDDILRAEGRDYDDVSGLTLRSLAGEDALLAVETQMTLTQTVLFTELEQRAAIDTPALIVIDTLADVYPANENDRAKVRQFIGILRGLAIKHQCAVILLGHPSLTGLNSGSGTSGSTAWNNSVRGRLYIHRIADDKGHEPDTDKRILATKKQNYGPTNTEIGITWRNGVFVADAHGTSVDRMAVEANAERVFLKLLSQFGKEGRTVKSSNATGYAPKDFAASGRAEGVSKQALHAAMERLFAKGTIVEILGGHGPPSKQTRRIVLSSDVHSGTP